MHYAEEFQMQEHITLVNRYVPNEDLQTYFDLADVVVLPYVSATQSAVVQLAFGCGKAVITTRVGGLHEVVEDGVTGLIVPPQDSRALADAVLRFFREGLREPFEHNVRCSSETRRFSWEHMVTTLESVYQSLQPE
jgi:glycosyltransferase involved in cell wall biosynthesis